MAEQRRPQHQIELPEDPALALLYGECLKFLKSAEAAEDAAADAAAALKPVSRYKYPSMHKTLGDFKLHIAESEIRDYQIIVVLGKKGTGKTTFLQMLGRTMEHGEEMPKLNVSYKPQKLRKHKNLSLQTVGYLLDIKIHDSCMNPEFVHNVMEPLHINLYMDKLVKDLSPGQLQNVALCLCLGKPADIYLIDELSAYLSPGQQRINATNVIKWFIRHEKKAAVVVTDDLITAFDLANGYIVIEGQPFVDCHVNGPVSVLAGLNLYLNQLDDDKSTQQMVEVLIDLKVFLDENNELIHQEAAESSSSILLP